MIFAEGATTDATTNPTTGTGGAEAEPSSVLHLGGLTMDVFDFFIIIFTIVIAWGVFRSVRASEKNKFAIGFGVVSLLVFLLMDVIMVKNWFA